MKVKDYVRCVETLEEDLGSMEGVVIDGEARLLTREYLSDYISLDDLAEWDYKPEEELFTTPDGVEVYFFNIEYWGIPDIYNKQCLNCGGDLELTAPDREGMQEWECPKCDGIPDDPDPTKDAEEPGEVINVRFAERACRLNMVRWAEACLEGTEEVPTMKYVAECAEELATANGYSLDFAKDLEVLFWKTYHKED